MLFHYLLCTLWVFVELFFWFLLLFSFYSWLPMHLSSFVVLYVLLHAKHFSYFPHYLHLCMKPWPHTNTHTHSVILRFRLKAFLSTRSVSVSLSFSASHPGSTMSSSCSLCYFLYLFLLASSTGNVTDHQVVLENGQKINGWLNENPASWQKAKTQAKSGQQQKAKSSSLKPMLAAPISGSSSEALAAASAASASASCGHQQAARSGTALWQRLAFIGP